MKIFYLSVIAALQISLFLNPPSASCLTSYYPRIPRQAFATAIKNGGVYKIQNERDSLYLTARNGVKTPGPSVLKTFANHPNQLWEASKIDKGFILKPLLNEFNSFTSQIDHHAHSYNTYTFQDIGNGRWIIKNVVSNLCTSSGGSKSLIKAVKCSKGDKGQRWKFYPSQRK